MQECCCNPGQARPRSGPSLKWNAEPYQSPVRKSKNPAVCVKNTYTPIWGQIRLDVLFRTRDTRSGPDMAHNEIPVHAGQASPVLALMAELDTALNTVIATLSSESLICLIRPSSGSTCHVRSVQGSKMFSQVLMQTFFRRSKNIQTWLGPRLARNSEPEPHLPNELF